VASAASNSRKSSDPKIGSGSDGPNYENTTPGSRRDPTELVTVLREPITVSASTSSVPDRGSDSEGETTSYENMNMDYISRLTGEGYSQELVIRALGITRNDIEMARDILHEFATRAS
jgi:E3 ubiquitin-protein ligase CBL